MVGFMVNKIIDIPSQLIGWLIQLEPFVKFIIPFHSVSILSHHLPCPNISEILLVIQGPEDGFDIFSQPKWAAWLNNQRIDP